MSPGHLNIKLFLLGPSTKPHLCQLDTLQGHDWVREEGRVNMRKRLLIIIILLLYSYILFQLKLTFTLHSITLLPPMNPSFFFLILFFKRKFNVHGFDYSHLAYLFSLHGTHKLHQLRRGIERIVWYFSEIETRRSEMKLNGGNF